MVLMKNLTWRRYVIVNVVAAAFLVNLIIFGPMLRMGGPFTAGLGAGIAVGWILFAVSGFRELKRSDKAMDERAQAIVRGASSIAFWILLVVGCLLTAAFRSEVLDWSIGAGELVGILVNFSLAVFGVAAFILWRRM